LNVQFHEASVNRDAISLKPTKSAIDDTFKDNFCLTSEPRGDENSTSADVFPSKKLRTRALSPTFNRLHTALSLSLLGVKNKLQRSQPSF
jgi:hypothetical protein